MSFAFLGLLAFASGALQVMGALGLIGVTSLFGQPFFFVAVAWFIFAVAICWADLVVTYLDLEPPSWRRVEDSRFYYVFFPFSAMAMQILVNRTLNKMYQV